MLAAPGAERPKLSGPTLSEKFRSPILFSDSQQSPRAPPKGLSGRGLRAHIFNMDDRAREQSKPPPSAPTQTVQAPVAQPREIGGPEGPEPTAHREWECDGLCTNF